LRVVTGRRFVTPVAYIPDPAYDLIQQFHPYAALNDVAFTPDGDSWAINNQARLLYQFNPSTGDIVRAFPYQSANNLMGLEYFGSSLTEVSPLPAAVQSPPSVIPNPTRGRVEFRWSTVPGKSARSFAGIPAVGRGGVRLILPVMPNGTGRKGGCYMRLLTVQSDVR
jgi:hypothetical protein